ncbi:Mannose-6-phosphate isomerase, type 1 [uncultured Paludibacter sp.]|nr:Mannose-6-phosphate isomerase, type 1 [uncultured Paludibacter sp.]
MYPLKFDPILKDKIWGGNKLQSLLGKQPHELPNIGESWELSGYKTDPSIVANGKLAGKSLLELVDDYKEELLGKKVYEKYGSEFPLLFKLIDANDDLSIQVHPNDEFAGKRHNSFGKTEMWYVLNADKDAYLIIGFNENTEKDNYVNAVENGTVENLLQKVPVKAGDVFFIPAGLVHAIGKGVMVAEIQQSSDVTYRIYDYKRKDDKGNERELHTEQAVDVIDYSACKNPKTEYKILTNKTTPLVKCDYFTTNILEFDTPIEKDYSTLDSFVVYMCLEESFEVKYEKIIVPVYKGETIMIPADLKKVTLTPAGKSKLLEVYI